MLYCTVSLLTSSSKTSFATLLLRKTPEFTLKKKRK